MLAVISTLSLAWAPHADPCAAHSFSYTCKTAPINKRVDDLLSKLSTQELIQQTWSPNSAPTAAVGKVGQFGVGQLSYGTSVLSHGEQGSVEARILRRNSVQEKIMAASRHGIPASFHAECLQNWLDQKLEWTGEDWQLIGNECRLQTSWIFAFGKFCLS